MLLLAQVACNLWVIKPQLMRATARLGIKLFLPYGLRLTDTQLRSTSRAETEAVGLVGKTLNCDRKCDALQELLCRVLADKGKKKKR